MRWLFRLALPLGLAALLAFPIAAHAQENVKVSGITHVFNAPSTGVTNSDLAFWGNVMYAGNFSGFRAFDISNPAAPVLLSNYVCTAAPGTAGQGDISVWNNILVRSVDTAQTKPECDRTNTAGGAPGWEGIDIIDVSNPAAPTRITGVATDCGSHTNTLIPDLANNRLLVYISSYPSSGLGVSPFGNQCSRPHDKISIVAIPLNAPQNASVIATPTLNLAQSLIFGGTGTASGCHDISVYLELEIAAGACLSEGVVFDISNPAAPTIKNRLVNPAIDFCARAVPSPPNNPLCLWHSATFTWDGKYMIFGDEAGGGGSAECSSEDAPTRGAFWLHSVANPTFPMASFKTSRIQPARPAADPLPNEICTAHIMNFVPINGRYVMPSSWYFGGTGVVDWTNLTNPAETAYFELDPTSETPASNHTNTWTTYWYNDFIFTNDINRGVDVLRLDVPWQTQAWNMTRFNPQTQEGLIRCRAASHGARLRANRRSMVHVQVRARGVAIVPGQPVVGTRVVLRGPGIRMTKRTNASGETMFMVRPSRRGTLQVRVPASQNMLACRTTRPIAAAPRRAAPRPPLTGRNA